MKKLVLLLASRAGLTACTAAPEVSSPPKLPRPPRPQPPARQRRSGGDAANGHPEVMDTGAVSVEIPFSGLETEPILKLDYAAGVQTKLCDIDLSRQIR